MTFGYPQTHARDEFETYYFHKLWNWIPEQYRLNDAEESQSESLKSLIETIASGLAEVRRDSERIWENSSVELADSWALPLFAHLTGRFPLSSQNHRAQRLMIANAVSYNKRKGTLTLINRLIEDVSGEEGYPVEAYRRLVRMPHRLDIGALSSTPILQQPQAGLPDMRSTRLSEILLSPLDETAHLADFRPVKGDQGYYDLPHLHIHLFPYQSFALMNVTPFVLDDEHFTLDPSGRDVALFHSGGRDYLFAEEDPDLNGFPIAMNCRRFNQARFAIDEHHLDVLNIPQIDGLAPLDGVTFHAEREFLSFVGDYLPAVDVLAFSETLVKEFILPKSLKIQQLDEDIKLGLDENILAQHQVIAAQLDAWGQNLIEPDWRLLAFDPATGRVIHLNAPALLDVNLIHEGRINLIGAGGYDREIITDNASTISNVPISAGLAVGMAWPTGGEHYFEDSQTYLPSMPDDGAFSIDSDCTIVSQNFMRPYVRFEPDEAELEISFVGNEDNPPDLILDGLWLGIVAQNATPQMPDEDGNITIPSARLRLSGAFGKVILRHMTLDPGGQSASLDVNAIPTIPTIMLLLDGTIEHLVIERCITGPIHENTEVVEVLNAGSINIYDSVIQSLDDQPAIFANHAEISLENCTILGSTRAKRLFATNVIFDGKVHVLDADGSCARYSALPHFSNDDAPSKMPRSFECVFFEQDLPQYLFISKRFGDAGFSALQPAAPKAFKNGADNGGEIGVGNRNLRTQRKSDLKTMTEHYMPLSLQCHIHDEF